MSPIPPTAWRPCGAAKICSAKGLQIARVCRCNALQIVS
jgi:hypothetical protein